MIYCNNNVICWERLKKITYNDLCIVFKSNYNFTVNIALGQLKKVEYRWRETYGLSKKLFFILKFTLFLFPASFILLKAYILLIKNSYKQIKGFLTYSYEGAGFPFIITRADFVGRNFRGRHINTIFIEDRKENTNINIKDVYTENVEQTIAQDTKDDVFKQSRSMISESTKAIRKYLIKNDFIIEGIILETKFPKISLEKSIEIVKGNAPMETYLVQKIDFGKLNKPLTKLFSELIIRKQRLLEGSYLILKDNDVNKLENSLRKVFMNNRIKVKVKGGKHGRTY